MLVCQQLGQMGLEALHARDGETGIEMFLAHRPDLVLLDVIMPGLDGFEVAHRIRQLEGDGAWTPIIFLTSRTGDDDLRRGIEVGGDDYLIKPVTEVVLRAKVRAMQRIAQMRFSLLVLTRKLDEANQELQRLSATDGLTGIANRRRFDESLSREWARAVREGAPLALLLLDVDYFKLYNDNYGHQAGDDVLHTIASTLASGLHRPTDLVARYGGEEFVVLLPGTDQSGALQVAEGLRAAVESLAIEHVYSHASHIVTVSTGLACCVPTMGDELGHQGLVRAADRALYQAKEQGRNRVSVATLVVADAA